MKKLLIVLGLLLLTGCGTAGTNLNKVYNTVDSAFLASYEEKAVSYIKALESTIEMKQMTGLELKPGTYSLDTLNQMGIQVSHSVPTSGLIKFGRDGRLEQANLQYENYYIDYDYSGLNGTKDKANANVSGFELELQENCKYENNVLTCN